MDPQIWNALFDAYPAPAPKTLRQLYAERAALAVAIPSDQHDHPEGYKALQHTIAQTERRFAAAWERADGHRPFTHFTEESLHYFEHQPRPQAAPPQVPNLPLRRVVDLRLMPEEGLAEVLECGHHGAVVPLFLREAMVKVYAEPAYRVLCMLCALPPEGEEPHED